MSAALEVCKPVDFINRAFLQQISSGYEGERRKGKKKPRQVSMLSSSQPKKYIVGALIEGTTMLECTEKISGMEVKCQNLLIAEIIVDENPKKNSKDGVRNKLLLAALVLDENNKDNRRKSRQGDENRDRLSQPGGMGQLDAHMRVSKSVHIAFPIDVFLDSGNQFLVFSKGHGNMHAHMRDLTQMMPEFDAKALFFQMVEAVADCHSAGIILNDMKLRRFIFSNIGKTNLCIENLDGCVLLSPGESDDKSYSKKNNPFYISPEAIKAGKAGHYKGKPSDVWSLGIMMYTMLCGKYPFQDANPILHLSKVIGGKYNTPEDMSISAACLISKMLNRDPKDRLTASEILQHPWFDRPSDLKKGNRHDDILSTYEFEFGADDQRVPEDFGLRGI